MDRYDLESGKPINCMNCIHFHGDTLTTCSAFPDGIPLPILSGDIQHDREIEGDDGITFATSKTKAKLTQWQEEIKSIITQSYGEFDKLLDIPKMSESDVQGFFQHRESIYSFTINEDKEIEYEIASNLKSDAYMSGYIYGDAAKFVSYSREDSERKCNQGIQCGNGCISSNKKCRIKLNPKQSAQVRNVRKSLGGIGTAALIGAGVVGVAGVAGVSSAIGTKAALKQARQEEEKLRKIAEEKARKEQERQAKEAQKISNKVRRVVASAAENAIPGTVGGAFAGGPVGALIGGTTGAAVGAATEIAAMTAERIKNSSNPNAEMLGEGLESFVNATGESIKSADVNQLKNNPGEVARNATTSGIKSTSRTVGKNVGKRIREPKS